MKMLLSAQALLAHFAFLDFDAGRPAAFTVGGPPIRRSELAASSSSMTRRQVKIARRKVQAAPPANAWDVHRWKRDGYQPVGHARPITFVVAPVVNVA